MKKKAKKSNNLTIPLLIFASALSITYLYVKTQLVQPISISEIGSTSGSCSQFVSSSISKNVVGPKEKMTITCDYGKDLHCIRPSYSTTEDTNNCTFIKFEGTKAVFECLAPEQPGEYTNYCTTWVNQDCTAKGFPTACLNPGQKFTVPTPTISIQTDCKTTPPTTTINWNDPTGIINQIELESRDGVKKWYSKKVDPASSSTDLTGFVGANNSNNPVNGQTLTVDKDTTYYAWAWYGSANLPATKGFKPYDCPVTPKPPVPGNPRYTCSPDGTSVKLSWDSVEGAESYKVRLDDKNGRVTNYDNLKYTQEVLAVTPGKQYSWWLHSHKDGQDSNQTTSIDFACQVQSTPTPTPTPTPTQTPKLVVQATPTPTPTPTTRAYIAPSTQAPTATYEYTEVSTETEIPATSTTEQPDTFLSRLIAWLKNIVGIN